MNELQWLQSVAAESDAPPGIDVASNVMRTLRERKPAQPTSILVVVALAGWAFAAVSVLVAQQMISALQSPLGDLLRL